VRTTKQTIEHPCRMLEAEDRAKLGSNAEDDEEEEGKGEEEDLEGEGEAAAAEAG
jgi:hypothetical protein